MEIEGEIRTRHERAACVAAALSPDNLLSMRTHCRDGFVVTEIRGTSLRSVIASVDDYLMNLAIAEEICRLVPGCERKSGDPPGGAELPKTCTGKLVREW
ncbi:MAG: KEOPS complex subunit Pcc1 [Methanolinea sp.]|nr:KEOPS complex subunit Pcc1 [Methanolinea sp.]